MFILFFNDENNVQNWDNYQLNLDEIGSEKVYQQIASVDTPGFVAPRVDIKKSKKTKKNRK